MPEHLRFVFFAAATRLFSHKLKSTVEAPTTGRIKSPYEEL